jgi:hypothetical protein
MNYQRIYTKLIERSKTRTLDGYSEKHHILPRCLGGTNEWDNIAILTPEEHFLAHQLLVKLHPGNKRLLFAAQMMTIHSTQCRVNNKMFGWMRRQLSASMSGDNNPNRLDPTIQKKAALKRKGQKRTEETKARMSVAQKGRTFSEETKQKMATAAKNRPSISEETRKKLSSVSKGRAGPWSGKTRSVETKARMSASRKGKRMSEETKAKMKIAAKIREENKRKQKELNEQSAIRSVSAVKLPQ